MRYLMSEMKKFILFFLLVHFIFYIHAQKPAVDSSVFGKWPTIEGTQLSNDGKYAVYWIINRPQGSHTTVIQSVSDKWKMELPDIYDATITQDSRRLIFSNRADTTLGLINLGRSEIKYVKNVTSFKTPLNGTGQWLAYQLNNGDKQLVLVNLFSDEQNIFDKVSDYHFNDDGTALLLKSGVHKDSVFSVAVQWVDLKDKKLTEIWEGGSADNFIFDASGTQLAFVTDQTIDRDKSTEIVYYSQGNKAAFLLTGDLRLRKMNFGISEIQRFSNDGNNIFISLIKREAPKAEPTGVNVDIWSYRDAKLQSQQLEDLNPKNYFRPQPKYTSVVRIKDSRITRLEQENEQMSYFPYSPELKFPEDFVIVIGGEGDLDNEWNWNRKAGSSVVLISLSDGSRKVIDSGLAYPVALSYKLSPNGKYIIYYNAANGNYYSYTISTRERKNLTNRIKAIWTSFENRDEPDASYLPMAAAGWIEDGNSVLLYDHYDIFQIDPSNTKSPINITNGYGSKHKICFRLAINDRFMASSYRESTFKANERQILSAFDRVTKEDGFYSADLGNFKNPEKLCMQQYIFKGPESINVNSFTPVKARNREVYMVRRMNASESENCFITRDFKTFTALSGNYPEKKYNWLTTKLVNYKMPDGKQNQGILYLPEDFDSAKKYPVIFYYYEKLSEGLNKFITPDVSEGQMNIPYFVSNGYLVFTPDIYKRIGYPGASAFNAVVGAANYLASKSWIDSRRMGLQGHSFGGFETNYIITHTNLFAAAMSASGMSDFISCYGSIFPFRSGTSRQRQYELKHDGMGASLWQRPDLYIKNSPVLRADKVSTPVLMMNNITDSDVPFAQGVEFFTALRRLGKVCWMLQYDKGDHSVSDRNAQDLTVRMTQFFDHYLKGLPAPKWMVEGIPAKMKSIDNGFELEPAGVEPGRGLLKNNSEIIRNKYFSDK